MAGIENKAETGDAKADVKGKPANIPLAQLKNGKVIFKQKGFSFEKLSETLHGIVKFREMLEQHLERGDPPLTEIPEEHRPVIAKLAHESDKTLSALAKYIHHELNPAQDDDNGGSISSSPPLSVQAVEAAIKSVATRNNYGLDGITEGKLPAAVCVWRWEVKEQYHNWLPKSVLEKAVLRISERIQAKKDLQSLFESMTQKEKNAILYPKGKLPSKEISPNPTQGGDMTSQSDKSPFHQSKMSMKKKSENEENNPEAEDSPSKGNLVQRKKTITDHEKVAKEKERLEKKAGKLEKEKREREARLKSQSLMANFFGKPKGGPRTSPAEELSDAVAQPPSSHSEFEKTFKPFVLKKDADLAPVNWFMEQKRKGKGSVKSGHNNKDAILVDDAEELIDGEVVEMQVETDYDINNMSTKDRLKSILSSLQSSLMTTHSPRSLRPPLAPHLKTHHPITVRDLMLHVTEAEIAGDISLVRSSLSKLDDLALFPRKVLIFDEDFRPGYFGTWTRNSVIIGPRSPLARDPAVLDYGYDSGEEWEDEGEADDVIDDGDEEDGELDDSDSDLDSWLVDDDEVEDVEPLSQESNAPLSPPGFLVPPLPPKRKADDGDRKLGKKRKVVVPLVPFAKGPCWEATIDRCENDLFKPYQIRLFNDTPFPIDPFTFVSTSCQKERSIPKELPSDNGFAIPALPERLLPRHTKLAMPALNPTDARPPNAAVNRTPPLPPKTTFPDAHLPFLLAKISSLSTGSMNFLVESVYQELRVHNVKKKAIEAKIREVSEKNKESRLWVVKNRATDPCTLNASLTSCE